MSSAQRKPLSAIPGNRRQTKRKSFGKGLAVEAICHIRGQTLAAKLKEADPARFILDMTSPSSLFSTPDDIELEIEVDGEIIIAGSWRIASATTIENHTRYVIERSYHEVLVPFHGFISITAAWLPSHIAILQHRAEDRAPSISTHIGELKDSPVQTPVTLRSSSGAIPGKFDFSADLASMSELVVNLASSTHNLQVGSTVVVDYVFCSVRYLFYATLSEIDAQFGDVILTVPREIIAVTDRPHWRARCQLTRTIGTKDGRKMSVTLQEISPTGAEVLTDGLTQADLGHPIAIFSDSDEFVSGTVVFVSEQDKRAAISFDRPDFDNYRPLLNLLTATHTNGIVTRIPNLGQQFQELYREVGYGRESAPNGMDWAGETQKIWDVQDQELPGNNLGRIIDGDLQISFGTLPVSATTVYGHSLAMRKSLGSIGHLFDILARSLWWTDTLPGVRNYLGAARNSSRFSTRLFTSIQGHADAGEVIFPALKIGYQTPSPGSGENLKIADCSLAEAMTAISKTPPAYQDFYRALASPSQWLLEHHQLTPFVLMDETGKQLAAGVRHRSRPYFTAADIFNFDGVFFADQNSIPWTALEKIFGSSGCPLEVLVPGAVPEAKGLPADTKLTPKEWYFVPRENLGPIVASFCRSIFQVVRKYGEDATAYLERMIAS